MRLLIFSWMREYTLSEVLNVFEKIGVSYDKVFFDVKDIDKSDCIELYDLIHKSLQREKNKYDAVFSINYFPDVAKACFENNTLYISWTYDCPISIRNPEDTLGLETNRAFFFDRTQFEEYINDNNTVFHFPLAVDPQRIKNVRFNQKFASDVSFVGGVYASSFPTLTNYLNDYFTGYLKGIIEVQKKVYGSFIAKDALDPLFIEDLNEELKKHNCPYTKGNDKVSLIQIACSLASEATFENRLLCLGLISKYYDLKWYTYENSQKLDNINKLPPVDYDTEMPSVFFSSKINLHIGLHSIPSGISLRQLDIMSCGGFLLSSFQPELFDYFQPEEDFDYYTCPEEALEKCRFYLSHDDLREKIAVSGRIKTNELFNYENRVKELLEIAFE